MNNTLNELITCIEEHYETGSIGHSCYIELITKARALQIYEART